jgi:protein-S-isoprenylcysteine O-methyltransferase Ste14
MRAPAIEFRLRVLFMVIVIVLGAWAPWIALWGPTTGFAGHISTLEWLALQLSRLGLVTFTHATPLVIVVAALIAAAGAVLRIWGTAYLGPDTVHNAHMKSGAVMAGGPFRYVRNPLYLGSGFMVAAIAFILPPTGALFVFVVLGVFLVRLILAEEAFLASQLGGAYLEYQRTVPRLFPRLRTSLPRAGTAPQWVGAILAEVFPVGVFVTLACLSWKYDNQLMIKAIMISFGASLVVRAFMPQEPTASRPAG